MASKYDSIKTAAELVAEVRLHGLSLAQEDITRAQDIFGRSSVDELVALANDIGRNNDKGKSDPKGTWSSDRPATQATFYSIAFHIWNWQDATRFWNLHTNPEHEGYQEIQSKLKAEMEEHRSTKKALEEQKVSTDAEHKFLLAERSRTSDLTKKIESLKGEVHDRDMTIMELKAKLYDLMIAGKEAQ